MNKTQPEASIAPEPLSALSASDKHCIFRSGETWFSVPAISVREIAIAPEMVRVPNCHPALGGLCHLRSEFVPIVVLNALLDIDCSSVAQPHNKLMVFHGHNVWALLIAETAALQSSETLITPETRNDDAHPFAIMGTSMYRNQIVRVLDPSRVFRLAQQVIEDFWLTNQDTVHTNHHEAGSLP